MGRAALWAPAWDERIRASVSSCGCIPYRASLARDAGFQAEFVVSGFAVHHDVEDPLEVAQQCRYLVLGAENGVWSRGIEDIEAHLSEPAKGRTMVRQVAGGHEFRSAERQFACEFLGRVLASSGQPTELLGG